MGNQEIWKDIEGYEGLYQVSNFGRVKSLNKYHHKREQILKPNLKSDGYYETSLSKNSKPKWVRTHRLVAQAFIPNPENKPQINHKDGNKLNNCIENLEWVTNKENIDHAIAMGLEKLNGHENPNAKPVDQYDLDGNFIRHWKCIKYASEELKIHQSKISMVCNNHSKTAGGYIWKFATVKEARN